MHVISMFLLAFIWVIRYIVFVVEYVFHVCFVCLS